MLPVDQNVDMPPEIGGVSEQEFNVEPVHNQFLTTVECAALLRLSPRTLERMRVEGAGPRFVKAGPSVRSRVIYPLADILAWTNARRFRSTSDYVARDD